MIKLKSLLLEMSPDVEEGINSVISKSFGWLTNKGIFYGVRQYGHLERTNLEELPLPEKTKKLYYSRQEEIDVEIRSREEKSDKSTCDQERDVVEIMEDNLQTDVYKSLYSEGWIRIGNNGLNIYEFEGTPDALKSKMAYILKFKNILKEKPGADIKLTPLKIL